jgi:hypothetical protein
LKILRDATPNFDLNLFQNLRLEPSALDLQAIIADRQRSNLITSDVICYGGTFDSDCLTDRADFDSRNNRTVLVNDLSLD